MFQNHFINLKKKLLENYKLNLNRSLDSDKIIKFQIVLRFFSFVGNPIPGDSSGYVVGFVYNNLEIAVVRI